MTHWDTDDCACFSAPLWYLSSSSPKYAACTGTRDLVDAVEKGQSARDSTNGFFLTHYPLLCAETAKNAALDTQSVEAPEPLPPRCNNHFVCISTCTSAGVYLQMQLSNTSADTLQALSCKLPVTSCRLQARCFELRCTRHKLQVTSYALQATSKHSRYELHAAKVQATSYKLRARGYMLHATSYKLHATSYTLQATSYKLQMTTYRLQATSYRQQLHAKS